MAVPRGSFLSVLWLLLPAQGPQGAGGMTSSLGSHAGSAAWHSGTSPSAPSHHAPPCSTPCPCAAPSRLVPSLAWLMLDTWPSPELLLHEAFPDCSSSIPWSRWTWGVLPGIEGQGSLTTAHPLSLGPPGALPGQKVGVEVGACRRPLDLPDRVRTRPEPPTGPERAAGGEFGGWRLESLRRSLPRAWR